MRKINDGEESAVLAENMIISIQCRLGRLWNSVGPKKV